MLRSNEKMREGLIILILAIVWLSSCGQRNKLTTDTVSIDFEKVDSAKIDNRRASPIHNLAEYIYTDTLYSTSNGHGITIQNSFPKGGMIDPDGTQYSDWSGKRYAFAVFWTRIINESTTPLELYINFPADSFAIFTTPDSYLKLFLITDTFSYHDLSLFNYGLSDVKSYLDTNFNKGTELQKTLGSNEEHVFYIATLCYKARGTPRGALILKGNDLYYRMSLAPDSSGIIPCGKIER